MEETEDAGELLDTIDDERFEEFVDGDGITAAVNGLVFPAVALVLRLGLGICISEDILLGASEVELAAEIRLCLLGLTLDLVSGSLRRFN